jgi:DAK2 domain fusion protein YloV
MALTMRAAVQEFETRGHASRTAGEVAARVEYGALMGARGNSGVILSQIVRGFSRTIAGKDDFDGRELAEALREASHLAYRAVLKPVEGTMLTVARETADAALAAAQERNDLVHVLGEALEAARASLRRTPDLLDLLRQAGVVDAGGQGLVVLLEGLYHYATGDLGNTRVDELDAAPALDLAAVHAHHPDDFGYCTNFMIGGQAMPYDQMRAHLAGLGHSAVIVGDERLIKVHLHTLHPGAALEYALQFGALSQIKIDNMDEQKAEFTRQQPPAVPATAAARPLATVPIALLAVASGEGFARLLTSLGVSQVISGGQTMNPSAKDILTAIEAVPQQEVIVLPNNGNIVLAARQAADLTGKRVEVVASRSLPQGLAAVLAFSDTAGLTDNAAAMRAALAGVKTGEITRAVRDVELHGVSVRAGEVIALLDDAIIASDPDPDAALRALLAAMGAADAELITAYTGQAVDEPLLERLRSLVRRDYPNQELEVLAGGQPHYDFILSVE